MGFLTNIEMRKYNNGKKMSEFHSRICNYNVEVRKLEKEYDTTIRRGRERDFLDEPTTDIEDKYIALDGYGIEGNIHSKKFSYPSRFIDTYLSNVDFAKNRILKKALEDNEDINECIKVIARCHLQIGSKTVLEIMHDLGMDNLVNDETRDLLPILDLYKNIDLFKYFNEEHKDSQMASKHEKLYKDLLTEYPFLEDYYKREISKTRELYEEIMLRMCYHIYMIKFAKIPRSEKLDESLSLIELSKQRNRIKEQKFISDEDLHESEQIAITNFLSQFMVTKHQKKILLRNSYMQ